MVTKGLRFYDGERGGNAALLSIAARVAYGMFNREGTEGRPDPGFLFLIQKICQRKKLGSIHDGAPRQVRGCLSNEIKGRGTMPRRSAG